MLQLKVPLIRQGYMRRLNNIMTMKKEKSVSVVLPVYNEAEIIEEVIREYYDEIIRKYPNSEFIIAEDGSNDGTKEILTELSKEIPMRLVMGPERKGYLHGVRDALLLAKNETVFFSDSDGQHDPRDFWKLLKKIENYDLVCGMRVKRHDPLSRKILTRFYNRLIWFFFSICQVTFTTFCRIARNLKLLLTATSRVPAYMKPVIIICRIGKEKVYFLDGFSS